MGELHEPTDETTESAATALAAAAEQRGDAALAGQLRTAANVPPNLTRVPLVIDTDLGGDTDDAVALVLAARICPELALIVTNDEIEGKRAALARTLMDLCGREDVRVVSGRQIRDAPEFVADSLISPDATPDTDTDSLANDIAGLLDSAEAVRWLGIGALTNLATLSDQVPEYMDRLYVTQMGGAFNYRNPERAEHNFRMDVDATKAAIPAIAHLSLVMSDVTFSQGIELTMEHELVQSWSASGEAWAQFLHAHLKLWSQHRGFGSMMHDPMALTVAMQRPFVRMGLRRFEIDDIGRTIESDSGTESMVSIGADYEWFMEWLSKELTAGDA